MDEQWNIAPFGYLIIDSNNCIIEMNKAMRKLVGESKAPAHVHEILTIASRMYFQTYFTPAIRLHGKVNEIFLTLKTAKGPVPVLMNAAERNGRYDCALIQMTVGTNTRRNCCWPNARQKKSTGKLQKLM